MGHRFVTILVCSLNTRIEFYWLFFYQFQVQYQIIGRFDKNFLNNYEFFLCSLEYFQFFLRSYFHRDFLKFPNTIIYSSRWIVLVRQIRKTKLTIRLTFSSMYTIVAINRWLTYRETIGYMEWVVLVSTIYLLIEQLMWHLMVYSTHIQIRICDIRKTIYISIYCIRLKNDKNVIHIWVQARSGEYEVQAAVHNKFITMTNSVNLRKYFKLLPIS